MAAAMIDSRPRENEHTIHKMRVFCPPQTTDVSTMSKVPDIASNTVGAEDSTETEIENPALYITPQHTIDLRLTEIETPSSSQVLLHIRCTGICGSDLHLWHRGSIGPLRVTHDCILGHESAGVVVAKGSAVSQLQVGDRVAIEPGVPCRRCFLCLSGRYNLCEAVAFAGVCPHAGTIRRFAVHEAAYCHKMPAGMSFAQGALLEPLSVVLHAISRCEGSLAIGRPALICGAGPIGLIALAAAKASGAWPLVITDIDEARLQFARSFVPGVQTFRIDNSTIPLECAEGIRKLYGCGARDVDNGIAAPNEHLAPCTVLECSGVESSIITAAYSCRRGGTVMVIGVGRSSVNNLPFMHLSLSEIDLKFTNRYSDTWLAGMNTLSGGRILTLDPLVTHTFKLHQAAEAMQTASDPSKHSIKVQIVDDIELDVAQWRKLERITKSA